VCKIHKGLEKIELTIDNLKTQFSRPLTPDDAIEAFKGISTVFQKGKKEIRF